MSDKKKNKDKVEFDREAFKKGIAAVESAGWNNPYLAIPRKKDGSLASSAAGKYQFRWKHLKRYNPELLKGITKEDFLNNPELQELVMDYAIDNKLKNYNGYLKNAADLTKEYKELLGNKWNYRPDEVAMLTHFLGRQGARNYLKSVSRGSEYKVANAENNLTVEKYLEKYNKALGRNMGIPKKIKKQDLEKHKRNLKLDSSLLEQPKDKLNFNLPERIMPEQMQSVSRAHMPGHYEMPSANVGMNVIQNPQPAQIQPREEEKTHWLQQSNDFLDQYLANNKFALGGNLNTNNMLNEDLLTEFNNGGSHEQNPLGGIPMGIGANGQPNLVEQGETREGDYVFSDRLVITKEIAEQFKLPKGTVGKTVAEASKKINDFSKESNSKIDKETTKENLERLKAANENLKKEKMFQEMDNFIGNEFEGGGFMDFVDSGKMGAATGAAEMIGGAIGGDTGNIIGGVSKGAQMGSALGPWGAAGGAIIGGALSIFGNEKRQREKLNKTNNAARLSAAEVNSQFANGGKMYKLAHGGNLYADGGGFEDALKLREAFGNPVGDIPIDFDINPIIANASMPATRGMGFTKPTPFTDALNKNSLMGGLTTKDKKGPNLTMAPLNNLEESKRGYISDYNFAIEDAGYPAYHKLPERKPLPKTKGFNDVYDISLDTSEMGMPRRNPQAILNVETKGIKDVYDTGFTKDIDTSYYDNKKRISELEQGLKDRRREKLNSLLDKAERGLRYSPALMNAIQLATMKKPEVESLDRIGTRFKPSYVDENQLINLINEQYGGLEGAIANASAGSTAAMRKNLLASGLNKTKAISDAFMKAEGVNRQQDVMGQQFNLGIDKFNIGQSNQEKDWNARNRAMYDANKSRFMSAIGQDLGNIGLEAIRRKYPELMGMNYNSFGEFVNDYSKWKEDNKNKKG